MTTPKVLVTGATGNQGGAVITALQERGGHAIRALVRKPDGAAARALEQRGVEVVAGDYDNPGSLAEALAGIGTVFAVTTPFAGVETEVRHGKALADAAAGAGVSHIVFSSVGDADRGTGIPHFDSKFEIETYLRGLALPWTITAPAFFYDNVLFPWNAADLNAGRFRQALPPERSLKQISVRDVGRFNALVISERDRFLGQRIDIAGDSVTGPEMAEALSAAIGRPITFQQQTLDQVRTQFTDMATMYEWFDRAGFSADIVSLHARTPEVGWISFSDWALAQDWGSVLHQPQKGVA